MYNWREALNRITIEFYCGVGLLEGLPAVANAASAEGEDVHPDLWDLYRCTSVEAAASLISKLAWDLNRFAPDSWAALPYAQAALKQALDHFVSRTLSAHALCRLVAKLDATFNVQLSDRPDALATQPAHEWWMGDLWNQCDWCDSSWRHENAPALVEEARRVAARLAEIINSRASP